MIRDEPLLNRGEAIASGREDSTPLTVRESVPILVIRPTRGWRALDLREIWRFRELLYFLVWRDLKVRYRQTIIGAGWAIIRPLFSMLVFTLFFGKLAQMPSGDIPYPVFSYAALLPWTYFATAVTAAGNSLVGSSHLITKVYFPRLLIPTATVLAGLVDYAVAMIMLVPLMAWYQVAPPLTVVVTVPLLSLLAAAQALGVSLWLSALSVRYRDVLQLVPFGVQLWMFATPIVYPLDLVPERYRWIAALNPMTGVIEGFRAALVDQNFDWLTLGTSVVLTAAILVSGAFSFRRMERLFADVI